MKFNTLLSASSLSAAINAVHVAQQDTQVVLSCDCASSSNNKMTGQSLEGKSFLDAYFGNFLNMPNVQGHPSNAKKQQPHPLSDELSIMKVNDVYQYPDPDDLRDLNGSATLYRGGEFGYVDTFAHLPLATCFDPEKFEEEDFDIAIVGAPFDSGVSYRPGARFGPSGIRLGSRRLAPAYSVYKKGFNPYNNWAKIVDCGSAPVTPLDNRIGLDQIYRANRAAGKHAVTKRNPNKHPKVFTLGGDHTITLPALKAAYENWGKLSVIHIDSHLDTWDPYYFGGNITEYQSLNHGTYLHYAHEKGLLSDTCIHAAIRGPYPGPKDVQHDIDCGFDRILARDIDDIGIKGVIERIKQRVGDTAVYITVDVDSLDPAFAGASGTIEPGGWSSRELLSILDGLEGLNVVGGDVVEVSPPFDTPDERTSIVAAQVADSIISLMILKDEQKSREKW